MENSAKKRLDWIDYAKGFTVIWVILYQCTTRIGYDLPPEGWVYWLAELGRPLRMPALFFVSGLLLTSSLQKNWHDFINSKVLHLIFFFVLWSFLQILMRDWRLPFDELSLKLFNAITSNPQNSLWFIAVLPLFFVITRLCRDVPPPLMLGIAALLEILHIGPYSIWTDNTSSYYIYFLFGIYGAGIVHRITNYFEDNLKAAFLALAGFILLDCVMVFMNWWNKPFLSLLFTSFALIAVIALGILANKTGKLAFFAFAGKNSLVIYLGYVPFVVLTLGLLKKTPLATDFSSLSLLAWGAGVFGALGLWFIVRKTPLSFLFERPKWLKI
jgi:uncharacterized membrane protein YcfT